MVSNDQPEDSNAFLQLVQELSQRKASVKIRAIQRSVLFKEKAPRRQLLQALTDGRKDVVAAAAEAIELLRPWITDAQWLETLQESSWQSYFAAIDVLGALGRDAPLRPLISAAVSKNRSLRSSAQDILRIKVADWAVEKQDQYITFYREHLQKVAAQSRVIALEMLGIMDDKVPIGIFLVVLNGSETQVRLAALEQLRKRGKQGCKLPIEPLAALLSHPDAQVRWWSMEVLATQKEDLPIDLLIGAMHDSNEGVIHIATSLLARQRVVQAIPELLEQLLTDPEDCWIDYTDEAFCALDELYEYVPVERLLTALASETEKVCSRAIILLSRLKERTPIELLLKLLEHKDSAIRQQAVYALGRHLTRIPLKVIVDKLRDRHKGVRLASSQVLLRSKVEIPAELLLPFLDCPENIARVTAVELLGKRTPLVWLIEALRDHKWTVRKAAIEILSRMSEQVPLEYFLEALCDRNLSVRRAAVEALSGQGECTPIALVVSALHDRRRVSEAAMEVLERTGKSVPRELLQALDDPTAHVRVMAIRLLQAIEYEEPFPVDAVKRMLWDSDARVREVAIQTLDQSGAIGLRESYVEVLKDEDYAVRKAALRALARLGDHDAMRVLLGDSETRRSAIESFRQTQSEVVREVVDEAGSILLGKGPGQVLGSLIQEKAAEAIGNMKNPGRLLVSRLIELQDWPYGKVGMKAEAALRKLIPTD